MFLSLSCQSCFVPICGGLHFRCFPSLLPFTSTLFVGDASSTCLPDSLGDCLSESERSEIKSDLMSVKTRSALAAAEWKAVFAFETKDGASIKLRSRTLPHTLTTAEDEIREAKR
uniref:Uncharacterized protein MANES_15G070100 n=1 Tax=Rhizophora mucronata TaxID=61149 RepID=A0A2P2LEP6_RHIMU